MTLSEAIRNINAMRWAFAKHLDPCGAHARALSFIGAAANDPR